MSMGSVTDSKFPGQGESGIPPSPTIENPGQVYPHTDPSKSSDGDLTGRRLESGSQTLLGNPFLMRESLNKLDHALGDVIRIIEEEEVSQGSSEEQNTLLEKFKQWRNDLDGVRAGVKTPERSRSRVRPEHEGGMFTD
ncbi:hypothetical protein PM082_019542 [Marasmius tenuissimus]|nr:hypothetical protein PM082_019822 [Marasmius tenuissimus]KAJ8075214.1 hypothetical protein PM082_019542 [Marasmius tenuissimus]